MKGFPVLTSAVAAADMIAPEVAHRLLYRSQFILGPRFVDGLEGWKRIGLGDGLFLSAHPDLDTGFLSAGKQWLAHVGYMLDPFNVSATNADLLANLLGELAAGMDLLQTTSRLGGRWILIVNDGERVRLFHDAVGTRQVYYMDTGRTGELWCASQPGIVGEMLHLQLNAEALALIASVKWPNGEHRLPGETSSYVGMKRLLPNHYLDLSSGKSQRYWPMERLKPLDFDECVESSSRILQGLMQSASRRFPLAISITGGWDSRLVLAAARRIAHEASYVTVAKPQIPSYDVEVPARLLPKLGLKHDVIDWPSRVDEHFARAFRRNVTPNQEVWLAEAYAVFAYNGLTKVGVTGSACELVRQSTRTSRFGEDDDEAITPEKLSTRAQLGDSRFAIEAFRAWLTEVPKLRNPSVLDLYRWEGRNWLATAQLTFDTAWKDILTPFNCRLLLSNMMAVNRNLRWGPRHRLFHVLMRHLWPEVLQEPFPQRERRPVLSRALISRAVRLSVRLLGRRLLNIR